MIWHLVDFVAFFFIGAMAILFILILVESEKFWRYLAILILVAFASMLVGSIL